MTTPREPVDDSDADAEGQPLAAEASPEERLQLFARHVSIAFFVVAVVVAVAGAISVALLVEDVSDTLDPFGRVTFVDYVRLTYNLALEVIIATTILAVAGCYFRLAGLREGLRADESDDLLDAIDAIAAAAPPRERGE